MVQTVREVDVAIRGGLVIDGSGGPGRRRDVGIRGDRIVLATAGEHLAATREIDATGEIVTPGFIDLHAHSGLMLLADPVHEAKVAQGVTTEIVGVDGLSYAPFPDTASLEEFVAVNAGLDGDPAIAYDWLTVPEYLDRFEGTTSVNVGMLIGNSALRIAVKGWAAGEADRGELADMAALLDEALDAGAFGLSTGLDYPPSAYASTAELTRLAEVSAAHGGMYHTHVRNWLGDRYLDPHLEAERICVDSGCHLHLTHLYKRGWSRGPARLLLELVERVDAGGPGATFDTYTYPYGSSRLCFSLPMWAFEEGLAGLTEALAAESGPEHERLVGEIRPRGFAWDEVWITNFRSDEHRHHDGRSVAEIAAHLGTTPPEAVRRLLVEDGLQLSQVTRGAYIDTRPMFLCHERSMIGSDGLLIGDHPSPRTYGAFATILETDVRGERRLGIEEAVRKMTLTPATTLGLHERGLVADGYLADVVVLDPERISAPATRVHPRQLAHGVSHVFVNGVHTWTADGHTGRFGGRALRHGERATPAGGSRAGERSGVGSAPVDGGGGR